MLEKHKNNVSSFLFYEQKHGITLYTNCKIKEKIYKLIY